MAVSGILQFACHFDATVAAAARFTSQLSLGSQKQPPLGSFNNKNRPAP
jgi:hypothetical protein